MTRFTRPSRNTKIALFIAPLVALAVGCGKDEKPADKAPEPAADKAAPDKAGSDKAAPDKAASDKAVADKAAKPTGDKAAKPTGDKAAAGDKGKDPGARLVKPASDVDWALIKKDVKGNVGKTVICNNLLAPVPLAVSDFADKAPLATIAAPMDDRRTALFCKTKAGGLDSVPVQAYFPKGDKGQLLHIDRDTIVNIEVRGEVGNQVVGVFRGIAAAPRRSVFDSDAPDLMSALLWPASHVGKTVTCRSKMAVTPQRVARFDRDSVEKVGGKVGAQKALVRCEDRRGGGISVELFFAEGDDRTVLKLGDNTVFTVTIKGFERNQLVAMFGELKSGAVETAKGGLKAVLVDVAPHVGKSLVCEALVAPQPREIGAIDTQETTLLKGKLDDRKTSLMCAEASGGSVAVSLYFKAGSKRRILTMNAKSKVRFTVWGVVHNRLVGLFEKVDSGAIETKDANDMRAVALSADKFAGKTVPCVINLSPFVSGLAYMGEAKEKLLSGEKIADKHAVITCKDATGSLGGTRAEVYFDKKDAGAIEGLKKGQTVKLRIKGSAFSTLIALYAGTTKSAKPAGAAK